MSAEFSPNQLEFHTLHHSDVLGCFDGADQLRRRQLARSSVSLLVTLIGTASSKIFALNSLGEQGLTPRVCTQQPAF